MEVFMSFYLYSPWVIHSLICYLVDAPMSSNSDVISVNMTWNGFVLLFWFWMHICHTRGLFLDHDKNRGQSYSSQSSLFLEISLFFFIFLNTFAQNDFLFHSSYFWRICGAMYYHIWNMCLSQVIVGKVFEGSSVSFCNLFLTLLFLQWILCLW